MTAREPMATPEEVAAYLGKSVQTLYNWRTKRIGPRASKVGNRVRYRWSDVDRWLDDRAEAAA